MSFSRANPSGWADDDVITPAQINGIDLNASRAVDGYAGGDINPSADINIIGANGIKWSGAAYPKLDDRPRVQLYPASALAVSLQTDFSGSSVATPDFAWGAHKVDSGAGVYVVPGAKVTQMYFDAGGSPSIPEVWLAIPLPLKCTIDHVVLNVKGQIATAPTVMPSARLMAVADMWGLTGGTAVTGFVSDTYVGYSTSHTIRLPATGSAAYAIDLASSAVILKVEFRGAGGGGIGRGIDLYSVELHTTHAVITP